MSAIFGYLGDTAPDEVRADLVRMDRALAGAHDSAAGCTVLPGAALGRRAWTRAPAAPGVVRAGATAFVLSGRIDNRDEVRAQLRHDGSAPDGGSDADLLYAAYCRWGLAALPRIAGAYAFAAWHGDTRRLVLVRSAIDAPPLHYRDDGTRFAFATMPRGLFALPGIARRLDRRALAMNLIRLSGPDPVTLYQGVQRLPTGAVLVKQGSAPASVARWWDGGIDQPPPPSGDLAEHAAALRELLSRVIAEQAGDAAPLALLLSGGLDSATVTALAARARPDRRLIGFTHVPEPDMLAAPPGGWYTDEAPLVRDIATKHANLDAQLLPAERGFFLDAHADQVMAAQERHFSNIGNLGWMGTALERARAAGAQIVLTGMQGNLTASRAGGPALPVALAARRWGDALHALTPRAALSTAAMVLPDALRRSLSRLRHAGTPRPWRAHSLIRPAFADAQRIDDLEGEWLETYRPLLHVDERPALLHTLRRQDIGLVDHALACVHGIAIRNPLADLRVANFCLALPNPLFRAHGQPRALIRAAVADLLPRSVIDNRLRGMQAADMAHRLQAHRVEVLAELARLERSDLAQEALDLPRLRVLAEETLAPPQAQMLLFGLTMGRFLGWLEREGAA